MCACRNAVCVVGFENGAFYVSGQHFMLMTEKKLSGRKYLYLFRLNALYFVIPRLIDHCHLNLKKLAI